MKHELSACILIPTSAVLYTWLKVRFKMHGLSLCFISAVVFIAVPTNIEIFNILLHLLNNFVLWLKYFNLVRFNTLLNVNGFMETDPNRTLEVAR